MRVRQVAPLPGQKPTAELSLDGVPRTSFEADPDPDARRALPAPVGHQDLARAVMSLRGRTMRPVLP
ncbi:hypothetical protein GCM10009849_32310 [Sinomonas flava]|uniref:Uncharacterized protein n=1 Tax=Sinomonas flava TaxID=496857 RepID=A0ABN3C0K0_9MICC